MALKTFVIPELRGMRPALPPGVGDVPTPHAIVGANGEVPGAITKAVIRYASGGTYTFTNFYVTNYDPFGHTLLHSSSPPAAAYWDPTYSFSVTPIGLSISSAGFAPGFGVVGNDATKIVSYGRPGLGSAISNTTGVTTASASFGGSGQFATGTWYFLALEFAPTPYGDVVFKSVFFNATNGIVNAAVQITIGGPAVSGGVWRIYARQATDPEGQWKFLIQTSTALSNQTISSPGQTEEPQVVGGGFNSAYHVPWAPFAGRIVYSRRETLLPAFYFTNTGCAYIDYGRPGIPMLVFSDPGYVNFATKRNYISLQSTFTQPLPTIQVLGPPTTATDTVAALAGLPGGLIIFGRNEALILQGDLTSLTTTSIRPYPQPIGSTAAPPAVTGSEAFVCWQESLWRITLGGAENVGVGVNRDAGFWSMKYAVLEAPYNRAVGLSSDRRRNVIVYTYEQPLLAYNPQTNFWYYPKIIGPADITYDVYTSPRFESVIPWYGGIAACRFNLAANNAERVYVSTSSQSAGEEIIIAYRLILQPGVRSTIRRIKLYASEEVTGVIINVYVNDVLRGTPGAVRVNTGHPALWVCDVPEGTVGYVHRLEIRLSGDNGLTGVSLYPPIIIEYEPEQTATSGG